MLLREPSIFRKLERLDDAIEAALRGQGEPIPEIPGRDVEYLPIRFLQGRIGLASSEGRQKLLHDLANIELQAMELALRTLIDFPWAPQSFREQLVDLIKEEAKHLKMCLLNLEAVGGFWGQWPVHLGLWHATHSKDNLLERILIVHRYLEGSGLDAGDNLLRRLTGVNDKRITHTVKVIVEEEVGHVAFGSHWYRHFEREFRVDGEAFFARICRSLVIKHPRRDRFSQSLRIRAGFSEHELGSLEAFRNEIPPQ